MPRPHTQFPAGAETAARAFFQAVGLPAPKSSDALRRQANNLYRQQQAGLPLSKEAARGHRVTPEHPDRRRPMLPQPASRYKLTQQARRSRYESLTQPLAPRPRGAGAGGRSPYATRPLIKRPRRHPGRATPGRQPPVDQWIVEIFHTRSAAWRYVRELLRVDPLGRVRFQVFDCQLGRYADVYTNEPGPGFHAPDSGITLAGLEQRLADEGNLNLEELLMLDVHEHYHVRALMTHICQYTVYYMPHSVIERRHRWRATHTPTSSSTPSRPRPRRHRTRADRETYKS